MSDLTTKEIDQRLNEFYNIAKTNGYVAVLAQQWEVSHTSVRRFLLKFADPEIYNPKHIKSERDAFEHEEAIPILEDKIKAMRDTVMGLPAGVPVFTGTELHWFERDGKTYVSTNYVRNEFNKIYKESKTYFWIATILKSVVSPTYFVGRLWYYEKEPAFAVIERFYNKKSEIEQMRADMIEEMNRKEREMVLNILKEND